MKIELTGGKAQAALFLVAIVLAGLFFTAIGWYGHAVLFLVCAAGSVLTMVMMWE